jgi:hypothetical protein
MSSSQALQQQQLFNKKIETLLQLHTHPLSSLTQSGATLNQVPQWNGSAWAAATVASAGIIDGGFPSDNYSNITTIDGGTP